MPGIRAYLQELQHPICNHEKTKRTAVMLALTTGVFELMPASAYPCMASYGVGGGKKTQLSFFNPQCSDFLLIETKAFLNGYLSNLK